MNSDPGKLISVASCASIAEATVLKSALDDRGIESVVNGDSLNSAFGNVGPSLSDAKILVRMEDVGEATEIVREIRDSFNDPREDPWFCGKCLEDVEAGFEVCWSCGSPRDEVEAPSPETTVVVENLDLPGVDTAALGRGTENPYESPRAMGRADEDEEEITPEIRAMESQFTLGLIFSVTSLMIPVLPAFAATAMFWFGFKKRLPLTGPARIAFWAAIVILVVSHLAWLGLWQVGGFRE